jgi:hypothetical protein
MIIIQNERKFTDAEFEAIDFLWRHYSINFPLVKDLGGFLQKALMDIHHAIMTYREPELVSLRKQMPKLKDFKFNYFPFLKWQKEQRGFKRFALGFSDSRHSRKAMKKAGLKVGDLGNLVDLAEKMKEAECRLSLP